MRMTKRRIARSRRVGFEKCLILWKELKCKICFFSAKYLVIEIDADPVGNFTGGGCVLLTLQILATS